MMPAGKQNPAAGGEQWEKNLGVTASLLGNNYKNNSYYFKGSFYAWYFNTVPHLIFRAII